MLLRCRSDISAAETELRRYFFHRTRPRRKHSASFTMSTLVNKQNKHGGSIRARDCYLKGVLRQYNQKSKVFMVTSSYGGHSLCRGLILLLTTSDRYPLCFQVNMFSNNFLVTRSVGSLFKRPSRLISLGHLANCVHEFGYCNTVRHQHTHVRVFQANIQHTLVKVFCVL